MGWHAMAWRKHLFVSRCTQRKAIFFSSWLKNRIVQLPGSPAEPQNEPPRKVNLGMVVGLQQGPPFPVVAKQPLSQLQKTKKWSKQSHPFVNKTLKKKPNGMGTQRTTSHGWSGNHAWFCPRYLLFLQESAPGLFCVFHTSFTNGSMCRCQPHVVLGPFLWRIVPKKSVWPPVTQC